MRSFYPLLFLTVIGKNVSAQFQYLSPSPASVMVNPQHNVIIREGHFIDPAFLSKDLFTISGDKSGTHDFQMVLSSDGKTIELSPLNIFAFSETVTITVHAGLRTDAGVLQNDFSFSFSTHRKYSVAEKERLSEQNKKSWFAPMQGYGIHPAYSNDSVRSPLKGGFHIDVNESPSEGDIFFDSWNNSVSWSSPYDGYHIITASGDSIYSSPGEQSRVFKWDLNPNGSLACWNINDPHYDILDSNYNIIDRYYAANGYSADPHDFILCANGHAFMIAEEVQLIDMTVYNPGYNDSCAVTGTVIQEFDENKNLIFEWRSFDHVAPTESNQPLYYDYLDYIHTNSLEIDTDGNIICSHRHLNQVTKIDHNSGEFIWRMGGQMNQFTFVNDPEGFNYQHDARRLANGHLTLWDNGNTHVVPHSTAKEYELDEQNHIATLVWSYSPVDPITGNKVYFLGMGSVQRLENGNTFINGGWDYSDTQPNMWEVTPDGNIVWQLTLNNDDQLVCYRAHRRIWNPCAPLNITDVQLSSITSKTAELEWTQVSNASYYQIRFKPASASEWKTINTTATSTTLPNLMPDSSYVYQVHTFCSNGHSDDWSPPDTFTTALSSLFPYENVLTAYLSPTLTRDQLTVSWNYAVDDDLVLSIYDQVGNKVYTTKHYAGNEPTSIKIDVSLLSAGLYFAEMKSSTNRHVEKFVKQ